MQNYWVVQIRHQNLTFFPLRTAASFIIAHPVFFVGKRSDWRTKFPQSCNYTTLSCKRTTTWLVCVQEASAGCSSFAQKDILIARQNLVICPNTPPCFAIITNLPTGWLTGGPYKTNQWSF